MLTTNQSYVTYLGNGATTAFPFSFIVQNASQLVVSITNNNVSPAVTTVLAASQYSVTGIGSGNEFAGGSGPGGTVTYPVSGNPLPSGWSITIQRVVPYTQGTSLTNQGGFYPQVVEAALDYLTMQTQQLVAAATGMVSFVGPTGPQGPTGPAGIQGPLGPTGASGAAAMGYVTPQQYASLVSGGTVGAGQDDTPAFAAAIATGQDVFVPNGSYSVTSLTLATTTQGFIGQSSQATILTGADPLHTILTTPSNWMGAIRHLQITRAAQVTRGSGANGVVVPTGSVGILDDLYVINSDINIYHWDVYGAQVLNCQSTYAATAAYWAVDPNIYYFNCGAGNSYIGFRATTAGSEGGGYFLFGCTGFRSQVNNVLVQGSSAQGNVVAVIINNFVSAGTATGAGIELDYTILAIIANSHVEWSGSGSVSGSTVNWSTPTAGVMGIVTTVNTKDVAIVGNQIIGSTGHGIQMLGSDWQILNNKILGSSYGYSGSACAIAVNSTSSNIQIIGNKTISSEYPLAQEYGLYLASNLNTYMIVADNLFAGTSEGIFTGGVSGYPSGSATNKIHDNIGTIPNIATPSVPSSTVAYANPYAQTCMVLIGGVTSATAINGVNMGAIPSGGWMTVILKPGDTITLTYSSAPGWAWNPL